MVCKDCVLEIVGPRPPVIQLSTDIRGSGSGSKGGSRVIIASDPRYPTNNIILHYKLPSQKNTMSVQKERAPEPP